MSESTSNTADLPETVVDAAGRTWFQVSEETDEYCDFWEWCGFDGHPIHRTLAQVQEGQEVSTQ